MALGALIDSLDLEPGEKARIKLGAEESAAGMEKQFESDKWLFYGLPKGWQKAPALTPAQVLGEPSDSESGGCWPAARESIIGKTTEGRHC